MDEEKFIFKTADGIVSHIRFLTPKCYDCDGNEIEIPKCEKCGNYKSQVFSKDCMKYFCAICE